MKSIHFSKLPHRNSQFYKFYVSHSLVFVFLDVHMNVK